MNLISNKYSNYIYIKKYQIFYFTYNLAYINNFFLNKYNIIYNIIIIIIS